MNNVVNENRFTIQEGQILSRIPFVFVKLRRGSGKDRQGMAPKAKGLKA